MSIGLGFNKASQSTWLHDGHAHTLHGLCDDGDPCTIADRGCMALECGTQTGNYASIAGTAPSFGLAATRLLSSRVCIAALFSRAALTVDVRSSATIVGPVCSSRLAEANIQPQRLPF